VSKIEWCDKTWNPVRGCSRVSSGCDNCYAIREAVRHDHPEGAYEGLTRRTKQGNDWAGKVGFASHKLREPLRWRKSSRVFVNSMSDLFHPALSNEQIAAVFGVMGAAPRHTFQVLTKRAARMRRWCRWLEQQSLSKVDVCYREATPYIGETWLENCSYERSWPLRNVYLGVSIEDQKSADDRIPDLLRTPAAVRFISAEPLLGPVDLGEYLECSRDYEDPAHDQCDTLDWVIVGGESGPGARPLSLSWIRNIVDDCEMATIRVPCFVKQLGARPYDTKENDETWPIANRIFTKNLKGGDPSEWEPYLRVRQFPEE